MRLWAGRTAALLGILLVALNLRTAVSSVSPILAAVGQDIPLSALLIGLVGMAPPLAFALSGPIAPVIARRIGLERALACAVAIMAIGHLGRTFTFSGHWLVAASVVTLVGVGIANVLLPPLVKRYFPDRLGLVTSIYVTLISLGAAVPAVTAVPVADAAGWRISLGIWFLLAITAAVPWLALILRHRRELAAVAGTVPLVVPKPEVALGLWRSPTAWAITLAFAVSSVTVYANFIWLPELLVDVAGVSAQDAGSLLGLFAIMGFPVAIVVPLLASRMRNVGVLVHVSVGCYVMSALGLLLAPQAAVVLWVSLAGLAQLLFPLALLLIGSRTRTPEGAVALSAFVQGVGYTLAAAGPLVFGLLHEASGGWTAPLVFILIVGLTAIVPAIMLARPRFVEDELA